MKLGGKCVVPLDTIPTFGVIFVVLLTTTVRAQEGHHIDFIRVIDSCIPEMADIESLRDHFLQSMFKMMSSKRVFLKTVENLQDRLSGWRDSSELPEWYYSRTFDYVFTESWKSLTPISLYTDWECLTVVNSTRNKLHSCLNHAASGLERIRNLYGSMNDRKLLKDKLCRATFQNCGRTGSAWLPACSTAVKRTLNVFLNVMNGYDCYINSMEPSTPTPGGDSNRTHRSQALSYCATYRFPHIDLTMLFPPSEASLPYIQTGYSVRDQMRVMDLFCKDGAGYSNCVAYHLNRTGLWADIETRKYINVTNFHNVVAEFCQHQPLITSQFECTVESLDQRPCYGGFNDIMAMYSENMLSNLSFNHICSNIQSSIDCRLKYQLSQCDSRYAQLIEQLYQGLLSDDCKDDRLQLDIVPCLFDYMDDLRSRNSDRNDPDMLYKEMGLFCSTYTAPIIDCIENKVTDMAMLNYSHDDVTVNADQIIWNINRLAEYSCGSLKSIQSAIPCVTNSLQSPSGLICLENLTSTMWTTLYLNTDEETAKFYCRKLQSTWDCLRYTLRDCDGSLLDVVSKVAQNTVKLCYNPNSPITLPAPRSGKTSVTLHYSFIYLVVFLCMGLLD